MTLNEKDLDKQNVNVLPFKKPSLKFNPQDPPGEDWLSKLPHGCLFLCRPKGNGFICGEFIKAGTRDTAVLLIEINTDNRESRQFFVDAVMFSQTMTFVTILQYEKEPENGREESIPLDT